MEFVVAEDDVWLSVFGVLPQFEGISGDDFVREVKAPVSETEELHITWDAADRSVRIRYKRHAEVIVDIYRAHATLLTIENHETGPAVVVEYRTEGSHGRTLLRTQPAFTLKDTFLRV
ncbi:hypothetical protein L3Q65_24450 [Amycolatopsis sp. FU40]|uniref:hypothetical protein n=1 Tax=Amycolatopsis sp. FU40 TaxID=2914159 RepID=UPI001F366864|nr:hypothetical protein [Amycolatopsis sp. FU40]UKD51082.1 hypothetical protein L3Q65_24450 [Amycolatopsis sp. FU40]